MHALTGVTDYQALRVTGHHSKKKLQVLLDIGSTHDFIDKELAHKLGCTLTSKGAMRVRVADGGKVACDTIVEGFQWKIQGINFSVDLFLMPLGGCDIVLGVQRFTSLGSVKFDYHSHFIDFPI